ncbi:MAG: GntR family transcriptional regulator, partial [Pirellulales bacterium]
ASPRVASELGIDPGTTIQRAVRVRYLDEVPFSHSSSHLIEHVGRTFTKAKLASLPLIELLSMAGIRIGHVRQGITATLADEILAKRLQVSVASPLLKVRRVFFDSNQRPVNYAEMLYCPDRFEYSMSLTLAARQQPARIASQPGRARRNGG